MSASWKQISFPILLLLLCWRGINTAEDPGLTPAPLGPTLPTELRSVVLKGTCRFSIVGEETLGNYSCVFGSEAEVDFIVAAPQLCDVRDKPIVSYVGDSVVITCQMEKPKPNTWNWYRTNGTDKVLIDADAEPHRYEIDIKDQVKTRLTVHNLTEADGGLYYCGAVYDIGTSLGHVELRVITFLQPLKPFIAIVVEVLILVTAILLYERSSKRNSTSGDGCDGSDSQTNKL
ncbi:embigin [Diretmus argenteus]